MKETVIYNAIVHHCQNFMDDHEDFAKHISMLVTLALIHRDATKIYNALTYDYQPTRNIAGKVSMRSNDISSILTLVHKNSTFIECSRNGKLKSWRKP